MLNKHYADAAVARLLFHLNADELAPHDWVVSPLVQSLIHLGRSELFTELCRQA